MKILVVDGILNMRQYYREKLERLFPGCQVFDCISAEDALFTFFEKQPQMIISSSVLSFRSAVQLSGLIYSLNKNVPVIIISNDDSCAIEAIKNHCFSLLVNPVSDEKFSKVMHDAAKFIQTGVKIESQTLRPSTKVKLSEGRGYRLLELDEIACFIADGTFTKIIFKNGEEDYSGYFLGKIEQLMPPYQFVRLHRSLLINVKSLFRIDKVKGQCIVELNDSKLEFRVSKKQIKKLEEESIL